MTPFGEKMRALRKKNGVTQKEMAAAIGVSNAYLSALENGNRGRPSWYLVQRIITFFNVIWDEAEEIQRLAQLSHPRIVIDTSGLDAKATEFANKLAQSIGDLSEKEIETLMENLPSKE
ncbi:MAG: helix-turn-helix domain-containing protein [Hyphomicrobiales bacterium]